MTTPECWTPGDVVLDAVGGLWVRAHEDSTAQGWPWAAGFVVDRELWAHPAGCGEVGCGAGRPPV